MDKITIYVGTDPGGCTFALAPKSRELLKDRRSDASPLPRTVSIGCDTRQDFIAILGGNKLRATIAEVLTDMTIDQLRQYGDVEFLDTVRDLSVFDPTAA